jgi:hypothetical protein
MDAGVLPPHEGFCNVVFSAALCDVLAAELRVTRLRGYIPRGTTPCESYTSSVCSVASCVLCGELGLPQAQV